VNVFGLRDRLVGDFAGYTRSFINIRDGRIGGVVERELGGGLLWPEPVVQLNPAFEPGETVDELVGQGVLHEGCARIFRRGKSRDDPRGELLRLHRHQAEAIKMARSGANYVLTTGTGSGKSLAYLVPIVDHVLRLGSGRGVQAVVVYPMNALANSQLGELEKFLGYGCSQDGAPVRVARYTGQESQEERDAIAASPPDVLLTNYVMLELVLTRPFERRLVAAASGLRFLVLDELHTYRGIFGSHFHHVLQRLLRLCRRAGADPRIIASSATATAAAEFAERLTG